jgi:hypothetical protein
LQLSIQTIGEISSYIDEKVEESINETLNSAIEEEIKQDVQNLEEVLEDAEYDLYNRQELMELKPLIIKEIPNLLRIIYI